MNEPIKVGDQCEVIAGALEGKGPNVGKMVTVSALHGEHSVHGRIWQCAGETSLLNTVLSVIVQISQQHG